VKEKRGRRRLIGIQKDTPIILEFAKIFFYSKNKKNGKTCSVSISLLTIN
jgi:hypothetical protein